jgi:hypothetical protein
VAEWTGKVAESCPLTKAVEEMGSEARVDFRDASQVVLATPAHDSA